MSVSERWCVTGCGRPAERGDPYCLACQLDGIAPELPPDGPMPPRRGGRERCPECGAELGAYAYRKSGRGLVVERRCPNRGLHMTEWSRRHARKT